MKAGVVILISDKADLRTRDIPRDKEGHFITLKYKNDQNITIHNVCKWSGEPQGTRSKTQQKCEERPIHIHCGDFHTLSQ